MLERDYEFAMSKHPGSVLALYNGASTTGILDQTQQKLFMDDGTYQVIKTDEFSYLTSKLPMNLKTCSTLTIDGTVYTIKESLRENKYVTTVTLVVKK